MFSGDVKSYMLTMSLSATSHEQIRFRCILQSIVKPSDLCTSASENEEKFQCLAQELSENIEHLLSRLDDNKKNNILRWIHYLMVLNCESDFFENLLDDSIVCHLMLRDPLNPSFVQKVAWNLSFHHFMCEVIRFSPPPIGVLLLPYVKKKIETLNDVNFILNLVHDFAFSIYARLVVSMRENCVYHSSRGLFNHLKDIMIFFHGCSEKLKHMTHDELHKFSAQVILSLMDLLTKCLSVFLNLSKEVEEMKCFYSIGTCSFPETKEDQVTLEEINELIFLPCKANVSGITVDEWMLWAEIDFDPELEKTMQTAVAESMYAAVGLLSKLDDSGDQVSELKMMLSSMARKPRDEDDEISDASLDEIIQNVSDVTKTRVKWFKALLRYDRPFSEEKCLRCVEDNLSLVDKQDVEMIIDRVVLEINMNNSEELSERLKNLALSSVKCLDLADRLDILEDFAAKHRISPLRTSTFRGSLIKVLNKTVLKTDVKYKEVVSECMCLCFESSKDVLETIVEEGLQSTAQGEIMAKLLKQLHSVPSGDKYIFNKIRDLLSNISPQSEVDVKHFLHLVHQLSLENVIDADEFLMEVLSILVTAGNEMDHSSLYMCLKIIHKLWNEKLIHMFDLFLLLVTVSQVLETCYVSIDDFDYLVMSVHSLTITIVEEIVQHIVTSKTLPTGKASQRMLRKLLVFSECNLHYFAKIFVCMSQEHYIPIAPETALLHLAYCERGDKPCCQKARDLVNVENKEHYIAYLLFKILPVSSYVQWNNIYNAVCSLFTSGRLVFDVYYHASILVLKAASALDPLEPSTMEFCKYFVRTLAVIIKKMIKKIPSFSDRRLEIFQRIIHILSLVHVEVREVCCLSYINILVKSMSKIHGEDMKTLCIYIYMMNAAETQQVLYKKLQELCASNSAAS